MTSKERVLAAARREAVDAPPVALYNGNWAIRHSGFRQRACYTDGMKLAEAQVRAWERLPQDVIVVQSDGYYLAEAMGSGVDYHDDGLPTLERPAISELSDVYAIVKPDPRRDGRIPVYLEGIAEARRLVGGDVAIRGCGSGPFVIACHLMGTERFMLELAQAHYGSEEADRAIRCLLHVCCDALIDFVDAQLDLGATIVQCADSSASIDIISPGMYESYALPEERRFFETVRDKCRAKGAVSLLHICGDCSKVFGLYARTGADIVEIDHKADLGDAKAAMGDRVCLMGNLDPVGHLLFGTVAVVEEATRSCLAKAGGTGYIVGSGCEVAPDAPLSNLEAVLRIARERRG